MVREPLAMVQTGRVVGIAINFKSEWMGQLRQNWFDRLL